MDQYELIRTAHRVYGKGIREIQRQTGHHRKTIRKALRGDEPKYRRRKPVRQPVMDRVEGIVEGWLIEDRERPKKQRHTAHRIYCRLVEEVGFPGAESTVRRWVREWKAAHGEGRHQAVVPLDPERALEAEVDWGTAWVEMAGRRQRVKLFVMRSRYSGKPFLQAYPWERQEMFFDGHIRAFHYYQGVFRRLVYDNLSLAVQRILRGKPRVEQQRFVSFRSYYTFEAQFCNPSRGQEKGGVEGLIGFARRNFLVPLPRVADFASLNALLLERCEQYGDHRIRGREDGRTVGERFEAEVDRLLPLPERGFPNVKVLKVRVDAYQTVRVDRNRYSVPRSYVGRWIWAHVGCHRVTLHAADRRVAEHPRRFSNSQWQIDPLHYLELLGERPQSFERARPILQWRPQWPTAYERLLASLRQRRGDSRGTREFVEILKLHRQFSREAIRRAVETALERQCPGYEAIRQLLHGAHQEPLESRPLPPGLIPGITDRRVGSSDVTRFNALLGGGR